MKSCIAHLTIVMIHTASVHYPFWPDFRCFGAGGRVARDSPRLQYLFTHTLLRYIYGTPDPNCSKHQESVFWRHTMLSGQDGLNDQRRGRNSKGNDLSCESWLFLSSTKELRRDVECEYSWSLVMGVIGGQPWQRFGPGSETRGTAVGTRLIRGIMRFWPIC